MGEKLLCDMCGVEAGLYKTRIEGTMLTVCSGCVKYGEIIAKVEDPAKPTVSAPKSKRPEIIQLISSDYSAIIKNKREEMGLKQKEFAKRIAEKESVIHKLESKHMKPSIDLARKLERFLNVKLIEQYEEKSKAAKTTENSKFTIADFIRK